MVPLSGPLVEKFLATRLTNFPDMDAASVAMTAAHFLVTDFTGFRPGFSALASSSQRPMADPSESIA